MKILGRTCFGKVMLFGEYSVVSGSHAALLPYPFVKAHLALPVGKESDISAQNSNKELQGFFHYLKHIRNKSLTDCLNMNKMKEDLENGLFFHSTIPEKYGLGSSGAICVAVLDYYGRDCVKQLSISLIRSVFKSMESYFHGSSSGVDPLSIYLGEPLIIRNDEYFIPGLHGAYSNNQMQVFMIDTMQQGETLKNMAYFRNQMKDPVFQNWLNGLYVPLVNRTVEEWMNGALKQNTIFAMSREQLQFLRQMIPPAYDEIWSKGIFTGTYALKLCGSGGGGMILGFTDNLNDTRNYLQNNYNINIITL